MYRMHARYFARDEMFETLKPIPIGEVKITKYVYQNGSTYEGQWRGGFRHGTGKQTWADGATYSGEWDMGYASGRGIFIDSIGNRYEGQFRLSMAHG